MAQKSTQLPVPSPHIEDSPSVQVCINREWASVIIAQIWGLRYPEAWGGTLDENRRARKEIQNLIDMLMSEEECMNTCCLPPYVISRVNPDTGMIEVSTNNGATWQPQPNGLPTVVVEPIPPVDNGTAGTKCDAAINFQTRVEAWITHVTNDFDTAVDIFAFGSAVIAAITDAILLILSAGTLTLIEAQIIAAISAAITAVYLAGKSVFSGYWTDDVKKQILCIALSHIGDNGSFTDAQFSAMWNDFSANLPGSIAKALFIGFLSSIGRQGVNAMAASGTSSGGDCTACACAGCDDLTAWETVSGDSTTGVITLQTTIELDVEQTVAGGDGRFYIQIESDGDDSACTFELIEHTGNSFDMLFAWNLVGETRGTFEHSGTFTDIYGVQVNAIMLRTVDANSMKLHVCAS